MYGVTNSNGAVMEHRHYDPYGNLFAGAMAETPYSFTGEWRDGGTGMVYLRARYYNPAHGAFVSQDALETPNRYAYVGGNVVNRVDPSGMLYLTFDDGPHSNDLRILDILATFNARATFFFHGANIISSDQEDAEIVWRVASEGHRLGNHAYQHADLSVTCINEIVQSLYQTETNIKQILVNYRTYQPAR
jgi:RHS repeat-associated protein